MRKETIILVAAALAMLPLSCKKDETTETKPGLSGITISSAPAYVAKGQKLTMTIDVSDITRSDETKDPGAIGLYWKVNEGDQITITEDISAGTEYEVECTPEELGTYSITCCAYAVDNSFYSCSASTSFKAIDPAASLTGDIPVRQPGEKYAQFTSGGLTWMAENLYETASGLSYNNCNVMDSVFGRYYTYNEALTACPSGWRLPTAAEFDALGTDSGSLMAAVSFLDSEIWPYNKEVSVTNATGFSALAVGYIDRTIIETFVTGEHEYAMFWTSDKDGDLAQYRYLFAKDKEVHKGLGSPVSLALSVRCVK